MSKPIVKQPLASDSLSSPDRHVADDNDPSRHVLVRETGAVGRGMDFFIGGMPRGGTTFFAQLFNAHEDVYCYFMETSLIRHLFMFGRSRPFPPENLAILEQWLRAELWPVLVEGTQPARVRHFRRLVRFQDVLRRHGLDEPSGPGIRAWDEHSFEPFLQAILALYRSGAHGAPLFLAGMQLLREHLGSVTRRPIVGEKTPDNLFHVEALQTMDSRLKGFCVLREPYSTLESMKRRALRKEAFFDSAFSTDVLRGIAEYYRHIDAAYSCTTHAEPGRFCVYKFEDLVDSPAAVMEQAYHALGLGMTETAARILPQLSIPTEKKHTIDLDLTATEHRLIEMILGPRLRHFGYEPLIDRSYPESKAPLGEAIIPLSGVYTEDDLNAPIDHKWMAGRADLFLLFGSDRSKLTLDLTFLFQDALGLEKAELRIASSGQDLLVCEFTPDSNEARIEVPLDRLRDAQANGAIDGALLTMRSSASFVPITVPGLGTDVRDFSFLIKSCMYG